MRAGFGKPKYSGNNNFKIEKPKTGNNFVRFLPPMKSLAEAGVWAQYETTHWGFNGVNNQDPNKTSPRPFRCIRRVNRRTKMVEQECPACLYYENLLKSYDDDLQAMKANGHSEKQAKIALKDKEEQVKKYRPERRYYVNAMLKDGTFCAYKLNHKIHKVQLDALIKELRDEKGIDALDLDQGVWFNILRVGDGFAVPDTVKVETEAVEVNLDGRKQTLDRIKLAPLSDEQAERALKECQDLTDHGGVHLTEEQIQALVDCGGDPEDVDRIVGMTQRVDRPAAAPAFSANARMAPPVTPPAIPIPDNVPANDNTVVTPPVAPDVTPPVTPPIDVEALEKRYAEIKARKDKEAAEAAARRAAEAIAKAKAAEQAPPPVDTATMDDEALYNWFNSKQK